jgi:23S rRNA pseudouridine2605 synthase
MNTQSLLKVLTAAGIGSRRRVADAIKHERVTVNGQVVTNFSHPVNIETDRILFDGKQIKLKPEKAVILMLNKPAGVISTVSDERGRQTVIDLLPEKYRYLRLYPVGRLDKNSTGLLLLTNDGELAYRLTHPRFEHKKEYLVHIEDSLNLKEKQELERGLKLADGMTHPAKVNGVVPATPFNYNITIHEGRKRQVRRMFDSLGHNVLALKRVRMGNLNLGDLPEGNVRELSAQEVSKLLNRD